MNLRGLGLGLLALLALAGCPDAEGEFCAFDDRTKTINTVDGVGTCENVAVSASCAACDTGPADPTEATGDYLFTLSASLAPATPLLFDADVSVQDGMMTIALQPLDRFDRMTAVGNAFTIGPLELSGDFCIDQELPGLVLPGAANSLSGSDLTADIQLVGSVCSPADFMCGDIPVGIANVSGAEIPIDGSTWTLQRLSAPGVYPDPPIINCNMDPAGPAPEMM